MSRRRKVKPKVYEISIESLSNEGRGISHYDDKIIFTRGALPGERVIASRSLSRAKYEEADVVDILESSPIELNQNAMYMGSVEDALFSTYLVRIKSMQNRAG